MKTPAAIGLIACAIIGSYFAGSLTSGKSANGNRDDQALADTKRSDRSSVNGDRSRERPSRPGERSISPQDARAMTVQERLAMMKMAASLGDASRQKSLLCGLIEAMSKEELTDATRTLIRAQHSGNPWAQEVWNTLWTQWGREDPLGCIQMSRSEPGLNTAGDYRYLMAGWLEISPQEALKWAKENTPSGPQEAAGAAFVLMSQSDGNKDAMLAAIGEITAQPEIAKACFQEYFDVTLKSADKDALPKAYQELSPDLRAAAWPVVMYRLSYTDRDEAKSWLERHAADPGRNYYSAYGLLDRLSKADPKGTADWATKLPLQKAGDIDADRPHPATVSLSFWRNRDLASATEWVSSQPAGSPWVEWFNVNVSPIKSSAQ